jgi:dipeptidyl-peptidase-4
MPEEGGTITAVTRMEGVHEPIVSPDGTHLATVHSNDVTPQELYTLRTDEGAERRVTQSPLKEFSQHKWIRPRYVTFKSRVDGFTLHARIIEPRGMAPGSRYPVVFGPVYSNTVRNEWRGARYTYAQMEALAGKYINVQVDLRGSIGYGVDFREAFQGDWGGGDLEDLHSAVEYLSTLPHVDMDRIGIWGSSYGGMMAMFAVFKKPDIFKVAVAGAPAIDPSHFTSFDQHLSRRPETHPQIFRDSNLLNYGEDLKGHLLFIQGMLDDIVPFRTTVRMMEKLMLLGKDFDLAVAPNAPHGWASSEHYAIFLNRKLQQYFDRHLTPGPKPARSSGRP